MKFRTKLMFWVLLGCLSVIFAEVVSGSSLFPFLTVWGIIGVFPLYTLHTLVLAWVIFRRRRVTLNTLFLVGMIFGLYEAYITKVLWNPTWGDSKVMVGGVAVVQTAVLVLFWHPWFAFILPVMAVENLFSASHETLDALPGALRRMLHHPRGKVLVVILFAAYCGMYQGMNAPSAWTAILSCLAAGAIFYGLAFWWSANHAKDGFLFRQLLPSGKEAIVLAGLLALTYLWEGVFLRPEALPRSIGPHLTIWAIYLAVIGLLLINLKKAPALPDLFPEQPHPIPWRMISLFWAVFALSAVAFGFIKPVAYVGVLLSWVFGVGVGLLIVVRSLF